MKIFLSLLFLLILIPMTWAAERPKTDHLVSGAAKYVVDGDTLDVGKTRIRLWGINTPEREQRGYQEAKDFLKNLTKNAKINCMAFYYDKWKRTVASCEIDGQDIGRMMVLSGMAIDYKRYSKGFYAKDEVAAKAAKRGMWGATK